jgi:hypothetical protein
VNEAVMKLLYGELGAAKMSLQQDIWHGDAGLERVLDRAVATVIAAGKPEHADDQYRPCVHEDLLLVYQMVDLPGYAPDIEQVAARFANELPPTEQCHFCMASLHVVGLYGQRKHHDAERAALRYLAELPTDEGWAHSRRLDLECLRADAAAARGDRDALRAIVEQIRTEQPNIDPSNSTLRAATRLAELRLAIADGDAAAAATSYGQVQTAVAAHTDFALVARTVYARYLATQQRWAEALAIAEPGVEVAGRRDAYRWRAELITISLDAHDQLDPTSPRRTELAQTLAKVLVKLKSRDLDT